MFKKFPVKTITTIRPFSTSTTPRLAIAASPCFTIPPPLQSIAGAAAAARTSSLPSLFNPPSAPSPPKQTQHTFVKGDWKIVKDQRRGFASEARSQSQPVVSAPRGSITDITSFLTIIGRNCVEHASRFQSWEHLFNATSVEMKDAGIGTRQRKYILGWRELYMRGVEPYNIPVPKRQKKYLKVKKAVRAARLQRVGET
ncbi:IGR protein motif-domain-containing protein [Cladochytrium replicatum]|nr:IGR protein motif-domain-containing protein [Cladochytrium replicatum]